MNSFGIAPPPTHNGKGPEWLGKATSNDLEKARSTIRQFYRDWSEEGASEREACYGPVIKALQTEVASRADSTMRVLVPGAGLGRLVFELCCAEFDTEGNEISYHQLLASSYILNHVPEARAHILHPWVHSFSNHKNRTNHLRSVQVPDVHPGMTLGAVENPGEMSMSASDFLLLYGDETHRDTFDAVATVFFLDTAPNISMQPFHLFAVSVFALLKLPRTVSSSRVLIFGQNKALIRSSPVSRGNKELSSKGWLACQYGATSMAF